MKLRIIAIALLGLLGSLLPLPPALADQTVASMSAASALTGTELLYCIQSGANAKCTVSQIGTYFQTLTFPAANLSAGAIPSSATVNNANWSGTGLALTNIAAIAADSFLLNATGGSASPTAVALPSCSTGTSALTYNTSTHAVGCNSIAGGGGNPGPYTVGSVISGSGALTNPAVNNVYCVNVSGAATLTLPSATTGQRIVLKNCDGSLSTTNTLTISPTSSTIDGASTYVMSTAYQEATFWWNNQGSPQWSTELAPRQQILTFCTATGAGCTYTNCSAGCSWTPPANVQSIDVCEIGSGGGAGSGGITTSGTAASGGGAGGAGSTLWGTVRAQDLPGYPSFTSLTAFVGTGGSGGTLAAGLAAAAGVAGSAGNPSYIWDGANYIGIIKAFNGGGGSGAPTGTASGGGGGGGSTAGGGSTTTSTAGTGGITGGSAGGSGAAGVAANTYPPNMYAGSGGGGTASGALGNAGGNSATAGATGGGSGAGIAASPAGLAGGTAGTISWGSQLAPANSGATQTNGGAGKVPTIPAFCQPGTGGGGGGNSITAGVAAGNGGAGINGGGGGGGGSAITDGISNGIPGSGGKGGDGLVRVRVNY